MKLHIPHPSKKVLLIAAAIVVVVAVFAYGAVRAEQFSIVTKQQQAHDRAVIAAKDAAVAKQLADAQTATKAVTASRDALCGYIKSLEANKTLAKYVTTPTAGNCSNPQ